MLSRRMTNRRRLLDVLATLVVVNGGLFQVMCRVFADDSVERPSKPNIVFILADDK